MAPLKFEENIKKKFEKRTLQPSANSWTKLSNDLDNSDSKRKRSFTFYMGIAASVIGMLLVTVTVFNSFENQIGSPTLVDTESSVKEGQRKTGDVVNNENAQIEVKVGVSEENKQENNIVDKSKVNPSSLKNDTKLVVTSKGINTILPANQTTRPIHNNSYNENETKTKTLVSTISNTRGNEKDSMPTTLTFEDSKALEVVNQIKKLKIENGTVSDAEIENLLKQAHNDIVRAQLYNKATRTVDADALLQDVEDDLEQSFRDKVFDGLKSGFRTIKTAVAERNN
jgi:hypothetical protein